MTLASIVAIPVRRIDRRPWLKIVGEGKWSKCGHVPARFTECGTFERNCLDAHCLRSYTVTVRPASARFEGKFTAEWKP